MTDRGDDLDPEQPLLDVGVIAQVVAEPRPFPEIKERILACRAIISFDFCASPCIVLIVSMAVAEGDGTSSYASMSGRESSDSNVLFLVPVPHFLTGFTRWATILLSQSNNLEKGATGFLLHTTIGPGASVHFPLNVL